MRQELEAVKFDRVSGDALFSQKLEDLCPLIPLELDDSTHIFVFDQRSIACELLSDTLVIGYDGVDTGPALTFLNSLRIFL